MSFISELPGWAFQGGLFTSKQYTLDQCIRAFSFFSGQPVDSVIANSQKNFVSTFESPHDYIIPGDASPAEILEHIYCYITMAHEKHHIKQMATYPAVLQCAYMSSNCLLKIQQDCENHLPGTDFVIRLPISQYKTASDDFNDVCIKSTVLLGGVDLLYGNKVITTRDYLEIFTTMHHMQTGGRIGTFDFEHDTSPHGLTIAHLLEAECRVHDYTYLSNFLVAGVPEYIIEKVLHSLFDPKGYHDAYLFFLKTLGRPFNIIDLLIPDKLFLLTIHLSFWTLSVVAIEPSYVWEDLQPCWRFVRICEYLRKKNIRNLDSIDLEELTGDICNHFRWPPPEEIALNTLESKEKILKTFAEDSPVYKDFYERHFAYCHFLLSEGYEPGRFLNIELENRLTPYCSYVKGDGVGYQCVPTGMETAEIFQFIFIQQLSYALFVSGDLAAAQDLLLLFYADPVSDSVPVVPDLYEYIAEWYGIKKERIVF